MVVRLRSDMEPRRIPASLSLDREYLVLGIEADDYRLLNDEEDPVLFAAELFDTVDANRPTCWETTFGNDGEEYAYPRSWPTFLWEDYHDRDPDARRLADGFLESLRPCSWPIGGGHAQSGDA